MPESVKHKSPFDRAWWGIVLTTIVAGPAAVSVVVFVAVVNGAGITPWGSIFVAWLMFSVYAAGGSILVGALGATFCAGIIQYRPLGRTLPLIFLFTLAADFLVFFLFRVWIAPMLVGGPIIVVVFQLAASVVALSNKPDPRLVAMDAPTGICESCGYSLAGLDRSKTSVCPECGEQILSRA